jgi:hypothetical protein
VKTSVAAAAAIIGVPLLLAFARYETVAPCGMLRSELKRQALTAAPSIDTGSGFAVVGFALGALALDRVIEARTASMGPLQCIGALARLHVDGFPASVSDDLRAEFAPPPESAYVPTWEFVSTTDPINDRVFNRAAIITDNGSLWVYLDQNDFRAGLRPKEWPSSGDQQVEFRVDRNEAFRPRLFANEDRAVYVTLTQAQVDQMLTGTELLVRYQGLSGAELIRFPLSSSADAIAQVGRPTPPPPPTPPKPREPSPVFVSLAEQIPRWEEQYDIGGTSSRAKSAASAWQNCIQIERVGPPPHTADARGRVLNCAMGHGFPLR